MARTPGGADGSTDARRPGGTAGTAARRLSGANARRHGSTDAWRPGARRRGRAVAQRLDDSDARRHGRPDARTPRRPMPGRMAARTHGGSDTQRARRPSTVPDPGPAPLLPTRRWVPTVYVAGGAAPASALAGPGARRALAAHALAAHAPSYSPHLRPASPTSARPRVRPTIVHASARQPVSPSARPHVRTSARPRGETLRVVGQKSAPWTAATTVRRRGFRDVRLVSRTKASQSTDRR